MCNRMAAAGAVVLIAAIMLLPAMGRSDGESPEKAPKAYELGNAALDQKEWALAIRYFAEARQQAKVEPKILFNLGLAHAGAGHELAGAAWFAAYLSTQPDAPDAPKVRKEITRLQNAAQVKRDKIFMTAIDLAKQLPDKQQHVPELKMKANVFEWIAREQAAGGDIRGALAAAKLQEADIADPLWRIYGGAVLNRGDFREAYDAWSEHLQSNGSDPAPGPLYDSVPYSPPSWHTRYRDNGWQWMAVGLAADGDVETARKAAGQIAEPKLKQACLATIENPSALAAVIAEHQDSSTDPRRMAEVAAGISQDAIIIDLAERLKDARTRPTGAFLICYISGADFKGAFRPEFVPIQVAIVGAEMEALLSRLPRIQRLQYLARKLSAKAEVKHTSLSERYSINIDQARAASMGIKAEDVEAALARLEATNPAAGADDILNLLVVSQLGKDERIKEFADVAEKPRSARPATPATQP